MKVIKTNTSSGIAATSSESSQPREGEREEDPPQEEAKAPQKGLPQKAVKTPALKIGASNGIFRGESLSFILKVANYLELDWLELKTELLLEERERCIELLTSEPEWGPVPRIAVHGSYRGINMLNITAENRRRLERDIDFARAIGSDRVVFHAGYAPNPTADAFKNIASTVQHLLDYSEGSDVLILLENASNKPEKIGGNPEHLLTILNHARHPRLGVTLDIVNLLEVRGERQKENFKELRKWVRHIQINATPVWKGELKMKKYVTYFLKDLKLKKVLKKAKDAPGQIPVILEGKTSLAREIQFFHELRRKLK